MKTKLTSSEQQILEYMIRYQQVFGKAPTLEEMRQGCEGINWRSSAKYVITTLLSKGFIDVVAPHNYCRRYKAKEAQWNTP